MGNAIHKKCKPKKYKAKCGSSQSVRSSNVWKYPSSSDVYASIDADDFPYVNDSTLSDTLDTAVKDSSTSRIYVYSHDPDRQATADISDDSSDTITKLTDLIAPDVRDKDNYATTPYLLVLPPKEYIQNAEAAEAADCSNDNDEDDVTAETDYKDYLKGNRLTVNSLCIDDASKHPTAIATVVTTSSTANEDLTYSALDGDNEPVYNTVSPVYANANSSDFFEPPADFQSVYHFRFVSINLPRVGPQDDIANIRIGITSNGADIPPLPDGCSLLHGALVHCLPHGKTFSEPVYLGVNLPANMTSPSSLSSSASRLVIYYSATDVGQQPQWTVFDAVFDESISQTKYVEKDSYVEQTNAAILMPERRQLMFALRHFCVFAVVVDSRPEDKKCMLIEAFIKMFSSSKSFIVDVLILVGCDKESVAGDKQFAAKNRYSHIESTKCVMFDNSGDVTVSLSRVEWMDDAKLLGPTVATHQKLDVWIGSTKSRFRISSSKAVTDIDSGFMGTTLVSQSGRRPVPVTIATDLHELQSASIRRPTMRNCRCLDCIELSTPTPFPSPPLLNSNTGVKHPIPHGQPVEASETADVQENIISLRSIDGPPSPRPSLPVVVSSPHTPSATLCAVRNPIACGRPVDRRDDVAGGAAMPVSAYQKLMRLKEDDGDAVERWQKAAEALRGDCRRSDGGEELRRELDKRFAF